MNLSDISLIGSLIAGLIAIPLAASTLSFEGDSYVFSSLNSSEGRVLKTISDNEILIEYQSPYGKFVISITPERSKHSLINPEKRVESIKTSDYQLWKLVSPQNSLIINRTSFRITEIYQTPEGTVKIIKENGKNTTLIYGSIKDYKKDMSELENELSYKVSLMKNMSEDVLGLTKVEISYLNCNGTETEYIEIKNNKHSTVSLGGWTLSDLEGQTTTYTFPSNFSISAGASLKLYRNTTGITLNDQANETVVLKKDNEEISRRSCDVW